MEAQNKTYRNPWNDPYIDLETDYKEEIKKSIFADYGLAESFWMKYGPNNDDTVPALLWGEADFKRENSAYAGTNYYFDFNAPEDREFIHFTSSKQKLLSIIKERAIRLYTLTNTNDPYELAHAADKFKFEREYNDRIKREILSFSFCKSKNPNANIVEGENANNKLLWDSPYGNYGKGLAFKFKIHNNPLDWYGYHMSSIKYGEAKLKMFYELKERLTDFKKVHPPLFVHMPHLFAFHKTGLWEHESEVRIVYHANIYDRNKVQPSSTMTSADGEEKYPVLKIAENSKSGEEVFYVELPLPVNAPSDTRTNYLQSAPLIEITEVILGYNYNEASIETLREEINNAMAASLSYTIDKEKIYYTKIKDMVR